MLVELACSTTLIPGYHKELFDELVPPKVDGDAGRRVVVFVVCGGFKIDLKTAAEYERQSNENRIVRWTVKYDDGKPFAFE